jgi:hypothetical protein
MKTSNRLGFGGPLLKAVPPLLEAIRRLLAIYEADPQP